MKNVPIKFRGAGYQNCYLFYGDRIIDCKDILDAIYIVDDNDYYLVKKKSLRRLVGYDENGNEVYEKCRGRQR